MFENSDEYETQGNPHNDPDWCLIHPEACEHGNPPTTSLHSNIGVALLITVGIIYAWKKFK